MQQYLPNLKMIELRQLKNLIKTPNFDGIPFLERFNLFGCPKLKEIHSSFGGLDRVVCLSIMECEGIKIFPSITRLKKLEILQFKCCPRIFELSEIQQTIVSLGDEDMTPAVWELSNLNPNIRLCFFRRDLRKLNLSWCTLRDEDINSSVWELPNLQELVLRGNSFSRLNFSLIRTPRLKFLNVSSSYSLVGLSGIPSSIAVLRAADCTSLKTLGNISNCEWLWRVSLEGSNEVDFVAGYMLLEYMLEGNAIEDHFISVALRPEIQVRFVNRLFRGNSFTRRLPCDWYKDFCGLLIHVVTYNRQPKIDIIIKQEASEYPPFEIWKETDEELEQEFDEELEKEYDEELEKASDEGLEHESDEEREHESDEELENESDEELEQESDEELGNESDEELEHESDEEIDRRYDRTMTYVGYVSFNSLRQTASLNSTHNVISISSDEFELNIINGHMYYHTNSKGSGNKIGAGLIPRKIKDDDMVQTTNFATEDSEFWDGEAGRASTFTIKPGKNSSIKIVWRPTT
ncbi:hypothetical protein LXL04_021508 [Taraxacum kok-saghyz]